jgi:hypothetical protein
MDDAVLRSLAKWPNVPAVFGWAALDRRGEWRLREPGSERFSRIGNAALREFIGRNYAHDEHGRWFFQNGPQRVYVRLERTPLVYRIEGAQLADHCGRAAGRLRSAWLDDEGGLVLEAEQGVGVIDDRDLATLAGYIVDETGAPIGERSTALLGRAPSARRTYLAIAGERLTLGTIEARTLPARFGFVADPQP